MTASLDTTPWYQKYLVYKSIPAQYAPYAMAAQIGLPLMMLMMLLGHATLHRSG